MKSLKAACDAVLDRVTEGEPDVPGVVAMVTDRDDVVYSGVRVVRRLGGAARPTGGWRTSTGLRKSWGYTFMINDEVAPTGRPAGSAGWAGLANCYFWIDRRNGIGGFWGSQVLPFWDVVSYPGFLALETAVYETLGRR